MDPFTVTDNVLWCLGSLYIILAIASGYNLIMRILKKAEKNNELTQRVRSWWIIVVIFTGAIAVNTTISVIFFGFISFLALKEFFSIIPTRRADRRVLFWVYLTVPIQYFWVYSAWYGMFLIFIPVYLFLFMPLRMVIIGETKDFLKAVGTLHWGAMTMIFSISHLAYLLIMPAEFNPVAGGAGLVLFLVFLTQFNDVAQFIWGKMLGRRKIIPKISPNKTWAGFIGGVITTTGLSVALAPILTPMSTEFAIYAGILISMTGFFGDVSISALKRDIGVKDSGSMLPGHGGILDRIDSLTYTAPVFFHFIKFFYYPI